AIARPDDHASRTHARSGRPSSSASSGSIRGPCPSGQLGWCRRSSITYSPPIASSRSAASRSLNLPDQASAKTRSNGPPDHRRSPEEAGGCGRFGGENVVSHFHLHRLTCPLSGRGELVLFSDQHQPIAVTLARVRQRGPAHLGRPRAIERGAVVEPELGDAVPRLLA